MNEENLIEVLKELINGKVVILNKTVKPIGTSGHIYIPREFLGKKIKVVIINEDRRTDLSGGRESDIPDEVLPAAEALVRESPGA